MLTPDIVDFIENLNSQLMQMTRFKILELKRLFPLLCSARFWDNQVKYLFLLLVFFCTQEQFTISLKYSRNRYFNLSVHIKLQE